MSDIREQLERGFSFNQEDSRIKQLEEVVDALLDRIETLERGRKKDSQVIGRLQKALVKHWELIDNHNTQLNDVNSKIREIRASPQERSIPGTPRPRGPVVQGNSHAYKPVQITPKTHKEIILTVLNRNPQGLDRNALRLECSKLRNNFVKSSHDGAFRFLKEEGRIQVVDDFIYLA